MSKVSVIIPTYNRAELLKRAIESVVKQAGFSGELIIIDDGSEDNTREVVESFQDRIDLRYVYQENRGPASARNRGVELANYDLVAFLDSDDHWLPDKIVKQVECLAAHREYRLCHTAEKWLRRGEHLNQKSIHKPRQGDIFSHCLQLCAVGMSTVMIERSLFIDSGGFDENLPCCEDYDFWLRVSCRHKFLLLSQPLTVKEGGRVDQLSYQYRIGMDKFRIYALQKIIEGGQLNAEQLRLALSELSKKCRIYGNGCIKHGQPEVGEHFLLLPEKYAKLYEY